MKISKTSILMLILLILSTIFFVVQHAWDLSWDFSAYVLNAKYLFYGGDYYEIYRAPLISVILGIFLIFKKTGEYIYLAFVSLLFFYANIKLSDSLYEKLWSKYSLNKEKIQLIFYLFSLNIIVLYYGLVAGTELLGLAFFELFLAFWLKNKTSGHFLALAVLSRYNFLIFGILLLINKKPKKIIKNLTLFVTVLFPWFLYNRIKWGNWLSSIIDSYYINIWSRPGLIEPIRFTDFLIVTNWILIFMALGIIFTIIKFIKDKKISEIKLEILFFIIALLNILDYLNTPFKVTRYLFTLTLSIAFFAVIGTITLIEKLNKPKGLFIYTIIILFLIFFAGICIYQFSQKRHGEIYFAAAEKIKELNITDCKVLSPQWVPVRYYTDNVFYLYTLEEAVVNNEVILIFPKMISADDTYKNEDLPKYTPYFQSKDFIIISKNSTIENKTCKKKEGWDKPRVPNPCDLIATRLKKFNTDSLALKICLKINKN